MCLCELLFEKVIILNLRTMHGRLRSIVSATAVDRLLRLVYHKEFIKSILESEA